MMSSPKRDRSPHDGHVSLLRRAIRRAAGSALLMGYGLSGLVTPAAASVDKVLNATPLVLKDGRIAEVSVHTIPFPDDAVAPASTIRNDLDAFTQTIATDCFLTAQVIGHVDKSETSGRETADIHRLARARADTIQESLVANGLPAASIASVWDWRFMVQQARVTLWVFRLTAGDDCEDAPLGNSAGDQIVEAAPTPAEPVVVAKAEEAAPAPAPITQQVIPAAKPRNAAVTAPLPAVPPRSEKADVSETTVKPAAAQKAARPGTAEKADRTKETKVAAIAPSEDVDKTGSASLEDDGALDIVFATNSSYFPEGAGDQLRAFMRTLNKDKSYVLSIQTSVDGAAGVSGASSDEAQRYNAWLAERRFKRVEAWLQKNAEGRELTLKPSLIENDGSRRIRIEPSPLG